MEGGWKYTYLILSRKYLFLQKVCNLNRHATWTTFPPALYITHFFWNKITAPQRPFESNQCISVFWCHHWWMVALALKWSQLITSWIVLRWIPYLKLTFSPLTIMVSNRNLPFPAYPYFQGICLFQGGLLSPQSCWNTLPETNSKNPWK